MDELIKRKLVLIDAGHGGHDSGAVAGGVREEDVVLEIGTALGLFLANYGYEIRHTRQFDVFKSLTERREMILKYKPDAFLSLHCNAIDDDPDTEVDERALVKGFEIYYRDDNDLPLAKSVHHYLARTGLKDRFGGPRQDVAHLGKRLAVLSELPTPSILIEFGYLTYLKDRKYVQHYKQDLAELAGHGVHDFLEGGVKWRSW